LVRTVTGNIIRTEDNQNFTKLVDEFRKQLDAYGETAGKHYLLTSFLPAAPAKIDAGFEVDKVFSSLDFGTVQGYDLHGRGSRRRTTSRTCTRPRTTQPFRSSRPTTRCTRTSTVAHPRLGAQRRHARR
jgi:hypothetical protein